MFRFASLLLPGMLLVAAASCGCTYESAVVANPEGVSTSPATIPPGSRCAVHFRRDAMGLASKSPVSIDGDSHDGATLTIHGRLKSMDSQWLVLKTGQDRETWIPRNVILHIAVFR